MQCPQCSSTKKIVKNGFTRYSVQKYICKNCKRQFIDRKFLIYKKPFNQPKRDAEIIRHLERGNGVRDIEYIMQVSRSSILNIISKLALIITPKKRVYKSIQIDELWSYVGNKKNKKWMIYAYCKETKEILGVVFGRRDARTVAKLYKQLKKLGVAIHEYCTDMWDSFCKVFVNENHTIGKRYTTDIEGINCLLRHRISRLVRRTCCFSKKLENHIKAIGLVIAGINLGTAWSTT
jgi:insertion element IS1 protein InsB